MRILITNDDGIGTPGLDVLEQIARQLGDEVWVVAPQTDQSGVAHSLTLHEPLRMRKLAARRFAVRGTPTDCVIMAKHFIMKDAPPDLVLSGVNLGQNTADEVTYSGTVAGAIEGTLLGYPSIALSLAHGHDGSGTVKWATPRAHGVAMIQQLIKAGWPEHVLLNVNFPDCEPDQVQGIAITRQAYGHSGQLRINDRLDTRGNPYFWVEYRRQRTTPKEGTDVAALNRKQISVTPLYLDLTHNETCQTLSQALSQTLAQTMAQEDVATQEPVHAEKL